MTTDDLAADPDVPVPDAHDPIARVTTDLSDDRANGLRRFNLVMAALHAVSGTAMVVFGDTGFGLPVTAFNLNGPPGTSIDNGVLDELFSVPLAVGTASFLWLSAIFHLIVGTVGFDRYIDELRHGRNRFRWVEYSVSSTLMIVLIALVTNITDIAALIAIAVVNASMILFGWIMEMTNAVGDGQPRWWTPFWFGCIAGIGPWIAIAAAIIGGQTIDGADRPPGFVYGIIVTVFLLFNCFAIVQWLQYRGNGKWADYVVGERVYVVLSLVAKSLLAWQIFANTLIE
ncbi:MAG: heliorhodopsin HeR [Actinomycetota bacterium]